MSNINNYRISKAGIDLIREFEGEVLQVYKCPAGHPTVGIGHLVTKRDNLKMGDKITKEQSEAFFKADIEHFENAINQSVKVPITQNEFDAIVSLAYNVGANGLRASKSFRFYLNRDRKREFADAMLSFNKAMVRGRLTPLAGLTRRRMAERKLFLKKTAEKKAETSEA